MTNRGNTGQHYKMVIVLGASARGKQVRVYLACGHHYYYTPANSKPQGMVNWYNTMNRGTLERCTRCYVPEDTEVGA